MARGNSKGKRRMDYTMWAIAQHKGEPFTSGDLIDMMKTKWKSIPSVREVGMVLSQLEKKGLVKYLGEEASLQSRRMLEQAGLTQHGLRKVALYVAVKMNVPSGEEIPDNE